MKKEDVRQHYAFPVFSGLEKKAGKEYLRGYSKGMHLDGFGEYLFIERAAPAKIRDVGNPNIDSNQYDTDFMTLYAGSLARVELLASSASPDNASQVLDEILRTPAAEDFFLTELQKRESWKRYVHEESVAAWYDDKRRAALRGLAKKGIILQEKQEPEPVIFREAAKPERRWPLYAMLAANTVILAGLAVGGIAAALYGESKFSRFESRADSIERKVNSSVSKIEKSIKPENIISQTEEYLRSREGQEKLQDFYGNFKIWWKQEGLAQEEFNKFWDDIVRPGMNSQGELSAQYICDELEKRYQLKKTAERLNKVAEMFGED